MREYFGVAVLLAALLWSSNSHAGSLYAGRCFSSLGQAAAAFAADCSIPRPFFSSSVDQVQPTSTAGRVLLERAFGLALPVCSITAVNESAGSVTYSASIGGMVTQDATSVVVGSGFKYPSGQSTRFTTQSVSGVGLSQKFPACTDEPTDKEKVVAIMALWPYALALVSTAWAAAFVRRRIVRWSENHGDES